MSDLPQGWAEVPLGTFSSKTRKLDPSTHPTDLFELYSVPAYASGVPDLLVGTDIGSVKQVVHPGDVLLCKIIPHLNRVWSVPISDIDKQIASPEWIVYRDHGCVPEYLRAALTEPDFRNQFLKTKSGIGGSLTRARTDLVNQIQIRIAPFPEQRRIVAKIDGLTARTARARADLDRIPGLIARYKSRLLALAYSGDLTAHWRDANDLREPVNSSVGELTEGLRYGTAKKCYSEPSGIGVLRIPNISSGRVSLEDLKYAELNPKEVAKLRLKDGDILIIRSNGSAELVGRPALVTGAAVGLAYAGYLIRIRPKQDMVEPAFLTFMLEAPQVRSVIEVGARSTSGVHNVNASELGELVIPLFALQEQVEIVKRIETAFAWLDRVAADHYAASKLLPKLDTAILARAFRGELVPQDPNDESASLLLDRIRADQIGSPKKVRAGFSRLPASKADAGPQLETSATKLTTNRSQTGKILIKKRHDPDVYCKPYLAAILRNRAGPCKVEALHSASRLRVADFYKQLAWEIDQGLIRDGDDGFEVI